MIREHLAQYMGSCYHGSQEFANSLLTRTGPIDCLPHKYNCKDGYLWSHSCWHLKAQLEAAGLVCHRPQFTPQEAERFIGAGEPSWHHPGRFLCHKRPSSRFDAAAPRHKRSTSRVELG